MNSSFLYLVTRHPDLLASHAQGYLALARQAWGKQLRIYQLQVLWMALGLGCFVVAAVHAGMLGVLYMLTTTAPLPSPWLTAMVPLVSLAFGTVCLARGTRHSEPDPFAAWNEQIATDLALLRESTAP